MRVELGQYPKPQKSQNLCELGRTNLGSGRGFLPSVDPVLTSKEPGFRALVKLTVRIPELLNQGRMVSTLDEMSQLPELVKDCGDLPLLERMYSMVVSVVHAYIFEKGNNRNTNRKPVVIPEKIAHWLNQAAGMIGRYPTQTYETYILQNYRLLNPDVGYTLENLAPLVTYTNSTGERWFIIMHVVAEYLGGCVLKRYADLENLFKQLNGKQGEVLYDALYDALRDMNTRMRALNSHLGMMGNNLSGDVFFFYVRPYLKSYGLGVVLQQVPEYGGQPMQWRGASGAQSSILPALDRVLGLFIKQLDTMQEMLNYMPPSHQALLAELDTPLVDIRALARGSGNVTLISAYNNLVDATAAFRQVHYEFIINTYILKKIVESFSRSITRELNRKIPRQSVFLSLEFIEHLLHQLFTVTKSEIVHRALGHLLERDHTGKLDAVLDRIQPVLKEMLRNHCDFSVGYADSVSLEEVFSKLHCDVFSSAMNRYDADYLLTADYTEVLSALLDMLHTNHKVLLSKTLGTGRTDFTYFLQNNIEQNKAAALPLPGAGSSDTGNAFAQTGSSDTGDAFFAQAGSSFLIGTVSGFSKALGSKFTSERHARTVSLLASSAAMWALDYPSSNIATFAAFQLILQGFDFPRPYIQSMSWAVILLACVTDLDPTSMMVKILIGMLASIGGETMGHYAAEKTASYLSL